MSAQGQEGPGYGRILGGTPEMKRVCETIAEAARLDVPVLILGETGTGKDLAAREIHARSPRRKQPYVAVNTGALTRERIASELFGHVEGALAAGRRQAHKGHFAHAHGGTLFLDEVSTADEDTQAALLRMIEDGVYRPVGAAKDEKVDVRLVAASNEDLQDACSEGHFRPDLMHRLDVVRVTIPPLRDRIEDLPLLVERFLEEVNGEFGMEVGGFSGDAIAQLEQYSWPGNVRELRNIVAQAVVLREEGEIHARHLPLRIRPGVGVRVEPGVAGAHEGEPETGTGCADVTEGVFVPAGATLDDVERCYVEHVLAQHGRNKAQTARILGISRKTLYERLSRWGIHTPKGSG